MPTLATKTRKINGKKVKSLRNKGLLPGVLYGPKTNPALLKVDLKEFKKIYREAGESSLISLKVGKKTRKVLIHDVQQHPLTDEFIHVDFYEPLLKEKIEATIPLVFEGEAPAVKDLGGTLVKNISEVEVKGLPQELPREIKVNIEALKTFGDSIHIRDIRIKEDIEILKELGEVIASVIPPREEEKEEAVAEVTEKKAPEEVEESEKSK